MLKKIFRTIIVKICWLIVAIHIKKFKPTIIGVTGSIGKTGTKRAIAHVLSQEKQVAWQDGNYNDLVTVPLVFFGLTEPSLFNPIAWLITICKMIFQTLFGKGSDVVVLELGTDAPGQIAEFGKYISLDIAVVTAISFEHMENFKTLSAVADEELSVSTFTSKMYCAESIHLVKNELIASHNCVTYGSNTKSNVRYEKTNNQITIVSDDYSVAVEPQLVGPHQLHALVVAVDIAKHKGLKDTSIARGVRTLRSMPGRMNVLRGMNESVIIDDSYNASPDAVREALKYLYSLPQKTKIAVIGNMNEMGELSEKLHTDLANDCDPKNITELITIGKDANAYLAVAAERKGCTVKTFDSPFDIGAYLHAKHLEHAAILFKGSQNGVFLEEAIKPMLQNSSDSVYLVRQSKEWLVKKHQQFNQ